MPGRSNLLISILAKTWARVTRPSQLCTAIQLNHQDQSLTINDRTISLTHKAWQVITILIDAAPSSVSRIQLIQIVWDGNFEIGEKGLNHALWLIRTRLCDDAAQPRLIKTIPRSGYQWIGPALTMAATSPTNTPRRAPALIALAAACMLSFTTVLSWPSANSENPVQTQDWHARTISASNGNHAYFEGRNIIVQLVKGCRAILVPSARKSFGPPTFSSDGQKIAIPVHKGKACSLVVVDLETRERQNFQSCPSNHADLASRLT